MRKSKLERNPDMIDDIAEMAEEGLPQKFIASAVGMTYQTLLNYLKRGAKACDSEYESLDESEKLYLSLYNAFEKGRAEFARKLHNEVAWGAEPRTKLTMLASLFPKEYGTRTVTDLDDLSWKLRKEYGDEATDKVLKILMEAEDEPR